MGFERACRARLRAPGISRLSAQMMPTDTGLSLFRPRSTFASVSQMVPVERAAWQQTEPPLTGAHMEGVMKKFVLAAVAALTLGMGVASANVLTQNQLPSPALTYSTAGG